MLWHLTAGVALVAAFLVSQVIAGTFTAIAFLTFGSAAVEPFVDRDPVAARWIGTGSTDQGPARFTGNDILRFAEGRFVEYWAGTSTG
jgi:hypothetical protein